MHAAGDAPDPPDRTPLVAAALAVLSVVGVALAPGVFTGTELLGAGTADTWGHAWGYGWTADALVAGRLPFFDAPVDHPGSQRWWVIDLPVALMVLPVTILGGSGLAYNLAMLGHVGVGAGAVAALARQRGAEPVVALAAGVMVAHSPFVRGVVASGVPEALGVLMVPLLVLWLDRGLRTGAVRPLAAAALLSVVLVLDGVYGALAGALAGASAVVAAVVAGRDRVRVLLRAGGVALPAGLAVWGLRQALHASEHPALFAGKVRTVLMGDAWILQPLGGSDLSAWALPAAILPHLVPESPHRHIVYVGLVLPVAMAWAAWRSPRVRRPVVVALVGGVLALGPALFFWGEPVTGAVLPGTWLWAAGATNLYRLAGLVPVMGLVAVAVGMSTRLGGRYACGLLAVVGIEWTLGAPVSLAVPTVDDPAGAVETWLADDEVDGAVLDLPFDREGSRARGPAPQQTFYLASVHGRPVASGLYKAATMETRNPALGAFSRSVRVGWRMTMLPSGRPPPKSAVKLPAPLKGRAGADLTAHLVQEGFSHVTLDLAQLVERQRPSARVWLEAWLGSPHVASEDGLRMGWRLDRDGPGRHQAPPERSGDSP